MTYTASVATIKAFSNDGTLETGLFQAHATLLDTLADVPGTEELSDEVLQAYRTIMKVHRTQVDA